MNDFNKNVGINSNEYQELTNDGQEDDELFRDDNDDENDENDNYKPDGTILELHRNCFRQLIQDEESHFLAVKVVGESMLVSNNGTLASSDASFMLFEDDNQQNQTNSNEPPSGTIILDTHQLARRKISLTLADLSIYNRDNEVGAFVASAAATTTDSEPDAADRLFNQLSFNELSDSLTASAGDMPLEALSSQWQQVIVTIYTITAITSIILNIITVIVLWRGRRGELRKYLINLSLSDLLLSALSIRKYSIVWMRSLNFDLSLLVG